MVRWIRCQPSLSIKVDATKLVDILPVLHKSISISISSSSIRSSWLGNKRQLMVVE